MAGLEIESKFLQTISKYNLLETDEEILVMVSGGRDSVALLNLLFNNISKNLRIFHLNHLLRESAQKDADFVTSLAVNMKLAVTSLEYDVKSFSEEKKLSIQDGARKIRYRLAYETAQKYNINKIAFGHQLDDNVETFLYRLIKGSGPSGLKSIPVKRGPIVRPLLNISRDEITKYLAENKMAYIDDPSNIKPVYARNKVRLEILPRIKEINPSFNKVIQSTIDIISQDDLFIENYAKVVFNKCAISPEIVEIDYELFSSLSNPIQRRFMRLAISQIKCDLLGIEFRHISEIQNKSSYYNFRLDLPDNITVFREADKLIFCNRSFLESVSYKPRPLHVPGNTVIKELDLSIAAKITAPTLILNANEPVIDLKKLKLPLEIRQWVDGDKFQPLGMTNKKKLQDFFTDKKIPKRLRKNIPIIVDREKIVWIAGLEIDNRVRLTNKTIEGLKLRLVKGGVKFE
jgi:tRNA(Ile)-lysidine synthase